MRKLSYALIVVAATATAAGAACGFIGAGWDGSRVWYKIQGEEGDTYYEWWYDWDPENGWHKFSEGKGWFNVDEIQTHRITVSGHGKIKIVVEGDDGRRERIVSY